MDTIQNHQVEYEGVTFTFSIANLKVKKGEMPVLKLSQYEAFGCDYEG